MTRRAATVIILAKQAAENGVDYSPRAGAKCPACKAKAKIYATKPWEGSARIRYHRCKNNACILYALGISIKSIEVDSVEAGG